MSAGVMLALFFTNREVAAAMGKLTIAKSLRGQERTTVIGSSQDLHSLRMWVTHLRERSDVPLWYTQD